MSKHEDKVTRETQIRSDALHAFLATPAGRHARQHGLISMLLDREYSEPPTVTTYRRIVSAYILDAMIADGIMEADDFGWRP